MFDNTAEKIKDLVNHINLIDYKLAEIKDLKKKAIDELIDLHALQLQKLRGNDE